MRGCASKIKCLVVHELSRSTPSFLILSDGSSMQKSRSATSSPLGIAHHARAALEVHPLGLPPSCYSAFTLALHHEETNGPDAAEKHACINLSI